MVKRGVLVTLAAVLALGASSLAANAVFAGSNSPGAIPLADPSPSLSVGPAAPVPDPVPSNCAWIVKGYQANCDGLDPNLLYKDPMWPTACTSNNDVLLHTVATTTMSDGSIITLTYALGKSSGCKTAAASLYAPKYSGAKVCRVTMTRASDGATSSSQVARAGGFWSAETLSLYAGNTTVKASATCTYGGHTYTGTTKSY